MASPHEIVRPPEMARRLGVTGLQLRNWLRAQAAAGHPLLTGHVKWQRWEFSPEDAESLMREFAGEVAPRADSSPPSPTPETRQPDSPAPAPVRSSGSHHRVRDEWMGEEIETLEDLLRPGLRAVVVGINPAPVSVAAGHYWQGNTGKTLWRRLERVGLMPETWSGFEDDAAFEAGVGFTDVVKRPTKRAAEVRSDELHEGRTILEENLAVSGFPLVIFVFKAAAETLLGSLDGNGFVGRQLGVGEVFVMPGPYEKRERADAVLETLRHRLDDRSVDR